MFEDQKKTPSPPPVPTSNKPAVGIGLEIPKSAVKSSAPAVLIHVMPKEYYGISPKTPVKKAVAPLAPKPAPPPPPPKPPVTPSLEGRGKGEGGVKKRHVPIVLIIGILFVVVIAVGGFFFLQSIRQPAPRSTVEEQPEPTPEPTPAPTLEPIPQPIPEPIRPGIDTDSDGLTDLEERSIYGSDPRNPDTDADSFIDGNEVLHLYDPLRGGNGALGGNAALTEYQDAGVSIVMPKVWETSKQATPVGFEFSIANDSSLGLEFYEKSVAADLSELARSRPSLSFESFTSKGGYAGVRSADPRLVILDLPSVWIVLGYNLGSARTIEFLRTFEMMVNSIKPLAVE